MALSSDCWMILFENNGWWINTMFAGFSGRYVPDSISELMLTATINNVVFDPNSDDYGWLILGDENERVTNDNLDVALFGAMDGLVNGNNTLKDVIIGPNNSQTWIVVCTDNAWVAQNIPTELFDQMGQLVAAGDQLKTVVFNPEDSNGWLIICENNAWVVNGNFPSDTAQKIADLIAGGLVLKDVVFMPGDKSAWMIICENNGWYFSGNFNTDIVNQIGTLMPSGLVLRTVIFGPGPI